MKLLVTGNGFDLAHGLPVKYTDMLDALFESKQFQTNHPSYPLNWLDAANKEKYSEVELFKHFKSKRTLTGWAGFENELQAIISYFITASPVRLQYGGTIHGNYRRYQYQDLKSIIDAHAQEDKSLMWNRLSRQLNQVCEFIDLYIQNLKIDFNAVPNKNSLRPIYTEEYGFYLTFNYSYTFQQNFNAATNYFSISSQSTPWSTNFCTQFIHGLAGGSHISIHNTEFLSPLVLGVHNDVSKVNPSDRDQINRLPFEKSFQRIQKRTGRQYRQWFQNSSQSHSGYSSISTDIYGHSLDVADHDVLHFIIEHSETTRIFYLDQTDYEQKIVNLVKMYGSMTEVEDRFYSGKITFEPIPT